MFTAKKHQENSILSEASSLVQTWISQINDQPHPPFGAESLADSSYLSYGNPTTYQTNNHVKEQYPAGDYLGNDEYKYLVGGDYSDSGCGLKDYVTNFDWSEGAVGENVQHVLSGLRGTEVAVPKGDRDWSREDNPVISIEMRHRRVKERRKQRDHAHQEALRDQQRKIDVRQQAREMIKKEEEERRKRERREEEAIRGHMAAIKRQMKEQKERERAIREHLENMENEEKKKKKELVKSQETEDEGKEKRGVVRNSGAVVNETDYIKIQTKIEVLQVKWRAKVLRSCFLSWYSLVQRHLGLVRKAAVVGEWRLLLRYWRVWRGVVRNRWSKKMALQAANELRQEKRKLKLAHDQFCYNLLKRSFTSWRVVVVSSRLHGKRADDRLADVKEMVVLYLSERKGRLEDGQQPGGSEEVPGHLLRYPETEERREMAVQTEVIAKDGRKRGTNRGGVWFKARNHVDSLLSEGARLMAEKHSKERENETHEDNNTESCDQSHDPPDLPLLSQANAIQIDRHKQTTKPAVVTLSKPPVKRASTKPLELKGMKERSALITERRLAREERKKKKEEEKMAELRAEEERKRQEEKKNKEVELERRREEKRLAAEREANRQRQLKHFQELTCKAITYYHKNLVKKCLVPWTVFTSRMKELWVQATRSHNGTLMRSAWWVWSGVVRRREEERSKKVDSFCRRRLLQSSVKRWTQFVTDERELLKYCERTSRVLLVRKLFRGWERVTRSERIATWEKERRARKHHERKLQQSLLHAWLRYIPIACEERKREVRRAELRRKVCLWLPDYTPQEQD